jgi:hypothetical protein
MLLPPTRCIANPSSGVSSTPRLVHDIYASGMTSASGTDSVRWPVKLIHQLTLEQNAEV